MPVNAYWVIMMENIRYSAHPTTISLFFNCIFILVVLTGLNGLVARIRPRWAFAQGELLLVYAMLCIGSCMAGHDFIQMLVPEPDLAARAVQHKQQLSTPLWPLPATMGDGAGHR